MPELERKLEWLKTSLADEDNSAVKAALMDVVPTFRHPDVVNRAAVQAEEMKVALEHDRAAVKV